MIAQFFLSQTEKPLIIRHAWPIVWLLVLTLHVIAFGILFWSVRSTEDLIILRYNAYLGIDLLGVWWQVYLMPALTFLFVLINLGMAKLLIVRGYPNVAALFLIGSILLAGSVVVVAGTLSFINI